LNVTHADSSEKYIFTHGKLRPSRHEVQSRGTGQLSKNPPCTLGTSVGILMTFEMKDF
jgi:hypothetical protein